MLECDTCGATENGKGMPFRSEQGLLGHKQFAHGERADGRSAATQRQVPMGAYEDLGEERDSLREEVEGLRASARQLKNTLAQAVALAASLHEEKKQLRGELAARDSKIVALQQEADALKSAVDVAQSRIPAHPPGLCQEESCESCAAQGQEIATAAFQRGGEYLVGYIDEALAAAPGEPLRERLAVAMAQGHAIAEQRKLEIVIIDDR